MQYKIQHQAIYPSTTNTNTISVNKFHYTKSIPLSPLLYKEIASSSENYTLAEKKESRGKNASTLTNKIGLEWITQN